MAYHETISRPAINYDSYNQSGSYQQQGHQQSGYQTMPQQNYQSYPVYQPEFKPIDTEYEKFKRNFKNLIDDGVLNVGSSNCKRCEHEIKEKAERKEAIIGTIIIIGGILLAAAL